MTKTPSPSTGDGIPPSSCGSPNARAQDDEQPTTWDAIKLLALLAMAFDHAGVFFFPDQLWLRAVGRIGAPVFFFLLGMAPHDRIKPSLPLAALLMVAVSYWLHGHFTILSALVTLLLAKLMLKFSGLIGLKRPWEWTAILLLALPSALWMDYGSLGLLFALSGRLHRDAPLHGKDATRILALTLLVYAAVNIPVFWPRHLPLALLLAGQLLLWQLFTRFTVKPARVPKPLVFLSRHSLAVYTLHLLALEAWAA